MTAIITGADNAAKAVSNVLITPVNIEPIGAKNFNFPANLLNKEPDLEACPPVFAKTVPVELVALAPD